MTEYERLRAALDKKLAADPSLRAVIKRIKNGTATLTDSAEYARVLSHILGREVSANVLDLDDRAGVVTQLLRDCYGDVNSIYAQAQTLLDEQAGIHINPQKPAFPAERVDQFTHSLIDPTVAESVIKRRARAGCETITKSYHDDCIKTNAQFRHDAGLKCYIVRIGTKCCEWCSEVAGKYEFGDQPDGIFRRHDNCDCTIIYDGQVLRGKRNADGSRSKTWEELPNANAADYVPPTLSEAEGRTIEQRNLAQIRGLKINNSSIDNSSGNDIITGRGSGTGASAFVQHTYEKIGEIDFSDKKAIAKSLQEFEQKYKDSRIEHCRVFCPNGEVYEVHGDLNNVNTDLLGDKMKGSINEHNHVMGEGKYTFSLKDVVGSADDGSYISMAYDEKYRYSMTFSDSAISVDSVYESYQRAKESVGNDLIFHPERIPIGDEEHERIKRTCEELGIKYSRVSR